MAKSESEQPYFAILVVVVFVAVGIATLMLAKYIVGIKSNAVLVALLLIPVFMYLTVTNKLRNLSIGSQGISASFLDDRLEDVKTHIADNVTEIGEYEEERSTYLGKLSQISKKTRRFCLIYADVDDLRQRSRTIFRDEEKERFAKRRTEHEIRKDIIRQHDFALAYAFCAKGIKDAKDKEKDAKYDIFHLGEPDIAMIARDATFEQAKSVARRAQQIFKDYTVDSDKHFDGCGATIAIVSRVEMKHAKARELDEMALERLSEGKDSGRGEIHPVS